MTSPWDIDTMRWQTIGVVLITMAVLEGCGARLLMPREYRISPSPVVIPHHPETATVVFLWPNRFADPNTIAVYQDDTIIGAIRGNTAFAREVLPGRHRFTVYQGLGDIDNRWLDIIVQAGQTIYIQYTGGPTGYVHFYLAVVPPEVAMLYLSKLSTIELTKQDTTPLPTVEELKSMLMSPDEARRVDVN